MIAGDEEVLYPWGYGTTMIDEATLWARLSKAHPEFRRRLFALIVAGRGVIGVGNLWRSSITQAANYARDPKTFAPAGLSFHETQQFASGIRGANAADMVGTDSNDDGVRSSTEHREAWKFLADNAERFGLVEFSNVNSEPWHCQSAGIPNSVRAWKWAGSPDPDPDFVLPDDHATGGVVPPPAAPIGVVRPPAPAPAPAPPSSPTGRLVTVNVSLPILSSSTPRGSGAVRQLQALISLKDPNRDLVVDGHFGPQTEAAVRAWQGFFGLEVDGFVGPKTWKLVLEA